MTQIHSDDMLDIAVKAGALVLENGGETYRAEDTVVHIATSLGAHEASAFVTPTVVIFSYVDDEGQHHSYMKRIFKRVINLSKVAQVNNLSRRLVSRNKISSPREVKELLHRIDNCPCYSKGMVVFMAALSSAFFTVMFGGNFKDSVCSFFIGGLLRIFLILLSSSVLGSNSFMVSLFTGAFLSILSDFAAISPLHVNSEMVLMGAIMQGVPGLALVNSIRDCINSDFVSGGARFIDACIVAAGLSIGSAAGVILSGLFI